MFPGSFLLIAHLFLLSYTPAAVDDCSFLLRSRSMPLRILFLHSLRLLMLLTGLCAFCAAPESLVSGLPGPGLWPRFTGAGLALSALLLPSPARHPASSEKQAGGASGLIVSCLVWILLLPLSGWIPATALSTLTACRSGGCSWKESLLLALLLTIALWLGLEHLLRWTMPHGMLFSGGV